MAWIVKGGGSAPSANLKSGSIAVTPAGVNVVFTTPMPSGSYQIIPICYDAFGAMGYDITNKTVNGFRVTSLANAKFDYIAAPSGT